MTTEWMKDFETHLLKSVSNNTAIAYLKNINGALNELLKKQIILRNSWNIISNNLEGYHLFTGFFNFLQAVTMNFRKRVVIIMSVGSHQNATFGFASKLSGIGFEVIYAGREMGIYGENLKSNATRQGYSYVILDPLKRSTSVNLDPAMNEFKKDFVNYSFNLLEGDIFNKFIYEINADLILLDVHLPIYAIAIFPYRVPVVFLSTELFTGRNSINPPLSSSLLPNHENDTWREEVENAWNMELNGRSLHPYFKLLIEELSIKNKFPLDELLIERCIVLFGLKYPELILWPEQFEFRRMNNKYCQYIGSHISLERKELYLDLSFLSDQKFVVYFSIGTILQNQRLLDFLLRLMDSFRGLTNCEFIVSVGKLYNHLESIRVPSNVFLYEHVPQLQVLSRTDLMITLAGGNSIKECIALGVPMLCYPFQSDQFGNASRVRFHKMGLVGSLNDSSEEIRSRINEILGNRDFIGNVEKFNETSSKEEASGDHIQALFHSYLSKSH